MADFEETQILEQEFRWLLKTEVRSVLKQLQTVIEECRRKFPSNIPNQDSTSLKAEKFILSASTPSQPEQLRCVVTLQGDNVNHAEIAIKLHKHPSQGYRSGISSDNPWKLQQIQDAGNHVKEALRHLESIDSDYQFRSSDEVTHILKEIMGCLKRSLNTMIVPKKRTIEELINSRNMKSLQPPLPSDLAVSFYVQSHRLVFAVYHIHYHHGKTSFDVIQSECSVGWLNEVLVLLSTGMQLAQQLRDKVSVFQQYKDVRLDVPVIEVN